MQWNEKRLIDGSGRCVVMRTPTSNYLIIGRWNGRRWEIRLIRRAESKRWRLCSSGANARKPARSDALRRTRSYSINPINDTVRARHSPVSRLKEKKGTHRNEKNGRAQIGSHSMNRIRKNWRPSDWSAARIDRHFLEAKKKMKRLKKLSIKEKPRQREIWIQDNAKKKWNPVQLGKTT